MLSQKKHLGQPKQMCLKTSIWEWEQHLKNFPKEGGEKKSPSSSKSKLEIYSLREILPAGRLGFKPR